ncbi:MAG: response regulator, partial [Bryobacteraceae bacterium]
VHGEILELKNTINTMVDQLSSFAAEVTRVAREVGTEGKLGGQADVRGVAGTWKDLTDSVNSMARNLTNQVRNIARVTTAVANGDLSRKITVDAQGEILELKSTINIMVDQLNSFASEVTRVAREVGTEGKLGGQADVRGVAGIWKDLTDNVNSMAANLTTQVRGIAKVVTAVANGDLKRKLVLETKGEIAELADTINGMIDTLAVFAEQVTTVAREVGIEGKLGGQARVPGTAGIWQDLTNNVNQLAANLTTQVRAIAEVATAVTKGDLTRSISLEAQGEMAALKDNINEMILNLAATTRKNTDQDWLKTNIAKFTRMTQGQRDLLTVAHLLLSELTPLVGAHCGTFYISDTGEHSGELKFMTGYACTGGDSVPARFKPGEGLVGECAQQKKRILVENVPKDYIKIRSSLGESTPLSIAVLPVIFEGEARAAIELASFDRFSDIHLAFLDQLTESIGIVFNSIAATMRTEELLKQSQALAEQLQQINAELQEKAQLLAEQKTEVEQKNLEVEQAKRALEEKAEQLTLTSKYKSEFLANMSHELRTPLNNLLILAKMLAENSDRNLSPKQVKFAETIHSSGTDLLALINDILDLSKIESGKMELELGNVQFRNLNEYCARTFRHVADGRGLEFSIETDADVPEMIRTDAKRLQQVLKNLLSNALKFTERGSVRLRIERATSGWRSDHPVLSKVKSVIAFTVIDTGIGIPKDKQRIIFEAFQQADGTTSRKYGGTGLGLSISRELARLLGGEIGLQSVPGSGSTFTLYLPQSYVAPAGVMRPESLMAAVPAIEAAFRKTQSDPEPPAPEVLAAIQEEMLVDDDRNSIQSGDRVLLIVEDDSTFARILVDMAHERGLKVLLAPLGGLALSLAKEFSPHAITLDITLPDMAGWTILDRLKHDPATRHIPIHVISGDEDRRRGLALGAISYLEKSLGKDSLADSFAGIGRYLERRVKRLAVVGEDEERNRRIAGCVQGADIVTISLATAGEALATARQEYLDGIIVDGRLAGIGPIHFVEELQRELRHQTPPVIIFAEQEPRPEDREEIRHLGRVSVVNLANSEPALLDQTILVLHRQEADLPEEQRGLLEQAKRHDRLAGSKVLVVDDDLRNIFALTSVLEQRDLEVVHAENGRTGIEILQRVPGIDLVLMDIMMPDMDGYETMRAIRQISRFRSLPIIALTAKAMKGDRAKCMEAGATDYIAKPVDLEQLVSVLRVWIPENRPSGTNAELANA